MKHFVLTMALLGLTLTGCAQNQVFGPLAQKSAQNFRMALKKKSRTNKQQQAVNPLSDVQLALSLIHI